MKGITKILIPGALVLLGFAATGCSHDLSDCCTTPLAVNYGPAGAPPSLVACQSYAVLAGCGVASTGSATTIDGDVGCSPTGSVSGLPNGQPTHGGRHENDTHAANAQSGCLGAYNDIVGRPSNGTLTGVDLGGRRFSAGVYTFTSNCTLNGTLTLDAQNNPDAVFVFQVATTLTCATNSVVVLVHGAQAKNVYWQCGSSATLGNNCQMSGTVIAQTNVVCNQGVRLHGRALARNGSVTLNSCAVTRP